MTILEPHPRLSDAELIDRARTGDAAAFADLHDRHLSAAVAAARQLARDAHDVDDLVNEAFVRVLEALRRGGGPTVAFRPYLLTTLRRVAYDRTDRRRRERPTEDVTDGEVVIDLVDPLEAADDRRRVAEAFENLPERWRAVLWHTEVEGHRPADVAPVLGLRPNAVAALAYRAREGLRQAYLTSHAGRGSTPACAETVRDLGSFVRGGLTPRASGRVRSHLDECDRCRAAHLELAELGRSIRSVVAVAVLGAAAGPPLVASLAADGAGAVGDAIAPAPTVSRAASAGAGRLRAIARPSTPAGWIGAGAAAASLVGVAALLVGSLAPGRGPAPTVAADRGGPPTTTGAPPAPSAVEEGPGVTVSAGVATATPSAGASAVSVAPTGRTDAGPPAPWTAPVAAPEVDGSPSRPDPGAAPDAAAPPEAGDPSGPSEPPHPPDPPDPPHPPDPPGRPDPPRPPDPPDPPVSPPPAPSVALVADVQPVGRLVAGRPGLLALSVTNEGAGPAPEVVAALTWADLSGPSAATQAGVPSWVRPGAGCTATVAAVECRRSDVAPGESVVWYLPVTSDAPAGRVLVQVTVAAPDAPGGDPSTSGPLPLEVATRPPAPTEAAPIGRGPPVAEPR